MPMLSMYQRSCFLLVVHFIDGIIVNFVFPSVYAFVVRVLNLSGVFAR